MKNHLIAICLVVLSIVSATSARGQIPELAKLAWIAGCWKGDGKTQSEEQWMKPAGQSMLGASRSIRDGKTVSFEFMQIRVQGDDIFYIPQPNGGKPVPFKLVKLNDDAAIFENPEHDFPQRIVYQRQIDGSLLAAIEGEEKGKPKRIEFPMKRVKCD